MPKPKLVALCGYPSSGKSTIAKHLVETGDFVRISTDSLREMFYPGISYKDHRTKPDYDTREFGFVWGYGNSIKADVLGHGMSVVFDSTTMQRYHRERIFTEGLGGRDVKKYLLRLDVDREELLRRGHPESVAMCDKAWEEPTEEESKEVGYTMLRFPNNTPED